MHATCHGGWPCGTCADGDDAARLHRCYPPTHTHTAKTLQPSQLDDFVMRQRPSRAWLVRRPAHPPPHSGPPLPVSPAAAQRQSVHRSGLKARMQILVRNDTSLWFVATTLCRFVLVLIYSWSLGQTMHGLALRGVRPCGAASRGAASVLALKSRNSEA